jgi:predicted MPP superfamily phosphohydrolase
MRTLPDSPRGQTFLRYAAAGSAAAGVALAGWAALVEPRLIEQRAETAEIANLPPAWDGRRIALLADLQVGAWFSNVDTVRRILRRLLEAGPALALIAGDFVYDAAHDAAGAIGLAAALVGALPARIPTYAVLGNHDYAHESDAPETRQRRIARELHRALEAAGVRVLQNEAVPLPPPGETAPGERPLYLVGIGEPAAGEARPLEAIRRVPMDAPRLVLMHNPGSFPDLPPGSAPLALAGHTHGGQIRVPFKPGWGPARLAQPWPQYVDGWIRGYGQPGNRLYVNRGVGFSHLPLRFGCRPELTLFTLRPGTPASPD